MYGNQSTGVATGSGLVGASLNVPNSQSATERETIALHEAVSQVDKLIGILHDRLHGVLRQPFPQIESNEKVADSLPPLASAIRQSRNVAGYSISKLDDILARLDI